METTRATSFGAWADEYDDWRPTYPDAAVDWLVPPCGARVAEVGAGTGKLTDRLIERGLALDVVEPDGRMLSVINQRHPRLRTHQTGAATLPFGDATVDAVLVADAWHWFPKTEAARGGRPGAPTPGLAGLRVERPGAAARVGVAGIDA
jgi:ubiquinone/menaquinone biosynthesis C-methylase UbiE